MRTLEAVQRDLFTTIAGMRREKKRAGSEVERSGSEEVQHTEQQMELMERCWGCKRGRKKHLHETKQSKCFAHNTEAKAHRNVATLEIHRREVKRPGSRSDDDMQVREKHRRRKQ